MVYSAVMPAAVMAQAAVLVPRSMMKRQRTDRAEVDDRRRFVCAPGVFLWADVRGVLATTSRCLHVTRGTRAHATTKPPARLVPWTGSVSLCVVSGHGASKLREAFSSLFGPTARLWCADRGG